MGTAEYHHAQAPRGCRGVIVAVVVHARCGTHCVALRVYIGMLFCEVCASRCAKAPLGVAHRFAPWRVHAAGITLSGLRWVRSHSRRRSPVAVQRPTRRQLAPLWLSWRCGISQALRAGCLVSGLRPVMSCAPPTLWPRRCAALALRWLPVRPQGAPSSQRQGNRQGFALPYHSANFVRLTRSGVTCIEKDYLH